MIAPIKVIEDRKYRKELGLKQRVHDLLKARAENPDTPRNDPGLTLGEILKALGLDKTHNGDVTSALHKLRNNGLVVHGNVGPSTSTKGRKYVKRYRWNVVVAEKKQPPPIDDRRFISFN